jgi:hypothetical protein
MKNATETAREERRPPLEPTQDAIDGEAAPTDGRRYDVRYIAGVYARKQVPAGFALRSMASGTKTFLLLYHVAGLGDRWLKVGRAATGDKEGLTLAEAVGEARRLRKLVDKGHDPQGERQKAAEARRAAKAAEQARAEQEALVEQAPTIGNLWEQYLKVHALPKKRRRSRAGDSSLIRAITYRLGAIVVLEKLGRSVSIEEVPPETIIEKFGSATLVNRLAGPPRAVRRGGRRKPSDSPAGLAVEALETLGSAVKVADVTHEMVEAMHRAMKGTPFRANRALALLRKMLNLAMIKSWPLPGEPESKPFRWYTGSINPCRGVEVYKESSRRRYLGDKPGEVERLRAAMDAYPDQIGVAIIRLLQLTGARKREVLEAKWSRLCAL